VIVVLDANILASMAVARAGGTLAMLLDLWRARAFEVKLSQHVYGELERCFADPYFTSRLAAQDIAEYLQFIRANVAFTQLTATVQGVATHPEDDLTLASAISVQARYLVTGDERFRRRVGTYQGVMLISPRGFLELLQGQQS
jgi:putative PIN family toxin of toxin-antitoxin system